MSPADAGRLLRGLDRDLRIGRAIRWALGAILGVGFVAAIRAADADERFNLLTTAAMTAALGWAFLSAWSMRQVRAANQASYFIASGRLDLAERRLREALSGFSIYRGAKLMVCHNLAVLAHGRGDYAAAAELCAGVLRHAPRSNEASRHTTRILLADCRMLLNDLPAAGAALTDMDVDDERMALAQRLMLLPIQVRYDVTAGRFAEAVERLKQKVRLAELLESPRAALVHALLAHACRMMERTQEAAYLAARAALYHDLSDLVEQYPLLATLADSDKNVSPKDAAAR